MTHTMSFAPAHCCSHPELQEQGRWCSVPPCDSFPGTSCTHTPRLVRTSYSFALTVVNVKQSIAQQWHSIPPAVLQSSRTLQHLKRQISSAVAAPKWQFSLFSSQKWWTPHLALLQSLGPALAAPSTATAMERVVMLVLRQEGISAPYIIRKNTCDLVSPRAVHFKETVLLPSLLLRHPSHRNAVTPMWWVLVANIE